MIENTVLAGLLHNEDYMRRVVPFLSEEYFGDFTDKTIFKSIVKYISDYNGIPTREALRISIEEKDNISDDQYKTIVETITRRIPQPGAVTITVAKRMSLSSVMIG